MQIGSNDSPGFQQSYRKGLKQNLVVNNVIKVIYNVVNVAYDDQILKESMNKFMNSSE